MFTNVLQAEHKMRGAHIVQLDHPTSWRLVKDNSDNSEIEEAVIRVQGIIIHKDLPPLTGTIK